MYAELIDGMKKMRREGSWEQTGQDMGEWVRGDQQTDDGKDKIEEEDNGVLECRDMWKKQVSPTGSRRY